MLIIGATYMLHLAWKTYNTPPDIREVYTKSGFLSCLTLQFINPKIYIYGIVSMQICILPHYKEQPLTLFGFALLLAFIGFVFTVCWSAFGSVFKLVFSRYARATNAMMALLLVYCAVSLFL